jgi:hypothetical protein
LPGSVAFRSSIVAALACGALVLLPSASGRSLVPPCGPYPFTDTSTHWEAVFGHRTSVAEAILLRRQIAAKGFRGVQFERDYCDDVELIISGVDDPGQRNAFFDEARAVGLIVAFEPPDNQKPNGAGEVTAVFAHRPTLKRASDVLLDIAGKGWRDGADIVRVGLRDWKVVFRHVPQAGRADFAGEARRGGYAVTFEG